MLARLPDMFRCLSDRDVHDVVLGGVTAIVHGVPRTTFVVDLLIDATPPKRTRAWGRVCVGVHVIVQALAATLHIMSSARNDRSQWPIRVGPLHDPEAGRRDMAYWMSRPVEERMAELDRLREEHDGPQPRLARVAVVIERQRR